MKEETLRESRLLTETEKRIYKEGAKYGLYQRLSGKIASEKNEHRRLRCKMACALLARRKATGMMLAPRYPASRLR